MAAQGDTGRCMMYACCCCYEACDCRNITLLLKGSEDCLCIRHSCCIAINTPTKGLGMTTDTSRGEVCKLGLFCCDLGLIWPTKVCACASQCLCCYNVGSLPCSKDYVPNAVCTCICPFLQCCPKCGCCVAPPPCRALDHILRNEAVPLNTMDRGEERPIDNVPVATTGGNGGATTSEDVDEA